MVEICLALQRCFSSHKVSVESSPAKKNLGVLGDEKRNMSHPYALTTQED